MCGTQLWRLWAAAVAAAVAVAVAASQPDVNYLQLDGTLVFDGALNVTQLATDGLVSSDIQSATAAVTALNVTSLAAVNLAVGGTFSAAALAASTLAAPFLFLAETVPPLPALPAHTNLHMAAGSLFLTSSAGVTVRVVTTVPSDSRFKDLGAPLGGAEALARLRGLTAWRYRWSESAWKIGQAPGAAELGLVAQEVDEAFPELVVRQHSVPAGGEFLGVDYARLTAVLAAAVKELERRVAALEAQCRRGPELRPTAG